MKLETTDKRKLLSESASKSLFYFYLKLTFITIAVLSQKKKDLIIYNDTE